MYGLQLFRYALILFVGMYTLLALGAGVALLGALHDRQFLVGIGFLFVTYLCLKLIEAGLRLRRSL